MLKNDPAFLIQILDDYSSGVTNSLEVLARRNAVNVRTLFMWMRDKNLTVNYMGRDCTFGQAMGMARNVMKAITVGRTLEDYVLNGRRVEIWHHGRPQFEEDETLVALGEEFVRDVLGLPDMYRRDANGNRILATRVEYAPAQLVETYARANMPAIYGNKSEVTMRGQVSLGVTTVGQRAPLPPQFQKAPQAVEAVITETKLLPVSDTPPLEVYAAVDDPELDEMLGPEPVAVPEPVVYSDAPTERERVAPPQAGSILAKKPISPSWQAELDKLAARSPLERSIFDTLQQARDKVAGQ